MAAAVAAATAATAAAAAAATDDDKDTAAVLRARTALRAAVEKLRALKPQASPVLTHAAWRAFAAQRTPALVPDQRQTQTIMLAADAIWRAGGWRHASLPAVRLEGGRVTRYVEEKGGGGGGGGCEQPWPRQTLVRFRQDCETQFPWVVHLCEGLAAAVVLWTQCAAVPLHRQAEVFAPLSYADLLRRMDCYERRTMLFDVEAHREAMLDVSTCVDLLGDLKRFCGDILGREA